MTDTPEAREVRRDRSDVSLRDFIEMQLLDMRRDLDNRLAALALAQDVFQRSLNTRLETMNEIRAQLAVQRSEFATREALDALVAALRLQIETFKHEMDTRVSRLEREWSALMGRAAGAGAVLLLVPIAIQLVLYFLTRAGR